MLHDRPVSHSSTPPRWHGSGTLHGGRLTLAITVRRNNYLHLGLGTYTMRTSRVFTLVAGVALLAACGSDGSGGNGPSNTAPTAAFTYECTNLTCTFTDRSADEDGTIASRAWDFGDN